MLLYHYYIKAFICTILKKRKYLKARKAYYGQYLNLSFSNLLFTPEGNKKLDAAQVYSASNTPFSFNHLQLKDGMHPLYKRNGVPKFVCKKRMPGGREVNVLFYEVTIAAHKCMVQYSFSDDVLYCIDIQSIGSKIKTAENVKQLLAHIVENYVNGADLTALQNLLIAKNNSSLLSKRFYLQAENHFGLHLTVMPVLSKYRSIMPVPATRVHTPVALQATGSSAEVLTWR